MGANPSSDRSEIPSESHRKLTDDRRETGELPIPFPGFAEFIERPQAEEPRDATERLHFEHHQADLERQRYQDLFEYAPDGYLETDLRGVVRRCNRAAVTLLDRPIQRLVGKALANFLAPEDRAAYRRRLPLLRQLEHAGEWDLALKKPLPESIREE